MRHVLILLPMFLMVVWGAGCAQAEACPPDQTLVDGACRAPLPRCEESIDKQIPVGCLLHPAVRENVAYFTWELTVKPTTIRSGEQFGPGFDGVAVFDTALLNLAQDILGGFSRVVFVDLKATVHVRGGVEAGGDDVVLEASPIPKTCTYDEDGNTGPTDGLEFPPCTTDDDCTGLGDAPNPANECLSYVKLETSTDCDEDGVCAGLGAVGPGSACDAVYFCVSEAVRIPLEAKSGFYRAKSPGSVLFGWADQGVALLDVGPNRGAYDSEAIRRSFGEDMVSGVDFLIRGVELALECVMGVNSRGPDGVPTIDPMLSPSPDGVLISCPIQEPE
jgi:hypothetical protein